MSNRDFVTTALAQKIEDAILFGNIKEIDAILEIVQDDADFPDELRYGLEALRYFREHYGMKGELEPQDRLQKQKAILMESAWGSELLDLIKQSEQKIIPLKRA